MNFDMRGVFNMNKSTIIPAAMELHKVPGFDPTKYLRRVLNDSGEPVMRLDPRYQRLWFRLACPKGRMLLNPLRITDQLAIFEAKVFFHRDDPTPASSFTSNKSAQDTPNYIRAAQDEALKEALDNAGFGIQLCDVPQTVADESSKPSTPPVRAEAEPAATELGPKPVPVTKPAERHTAAPAETQAIGTAHVQKDALAPVLAEQAVGREADPVSVKEVVPTQEQERDMPVAAQREESEPKAGPQSELAAILNFPEPVAEAAEPQEIKDTTPPTTVEESAPVLDVTGPSAPADTAAGSVETLLQTTPRYTEDMSVEDICKVMTLDEARGIIVPKGPCSGWTMGQVEERRFASLRFYLTPFCDYGNVQKAAATLLVQNADQQKAS